MSDWPGFVRGSLAFHAYVAAFGVVWPDRWPWLAGALVANHSALVAAGLTPRSRWLGPNLTRLPATAAARREVGLTFDDGPHPEITPEVLRILEVRNARASFFCVGTRMERARAVVQAIAQGGHTVENHTHRHSAAFFFHAPRSLRRELAACSGIIREVTGRRPAWFRAPAGFRGPLLQPVLEEQGLALVSWTRRGFDAFEHDPKKVVGRLTRNLRAGDILLLHDGSGAVTGTGRPVVLEALPAILDAVEAAGLHTVALPERTVD